MGPDVQQRAFQKLLSIHLFLKRHNVSMDNVNMSMLVGFQTVSVTSPPTGQQ